MAFAPYKDCVAKLVKGCFDLRWHNYQGHVSPYVHFEYANRTPEDIEAIGWPEYDKWIYVVDGKETRCAKVLKTVAYVVVDEAADGSPVVEKWLIKNHKVYDLT